MATTQSMLTSIASYDNVRIVDQIIDEMESGYFFNSARLVDLVLRDARLMAVMSTRISGLLGEELDLEPAKDTARAEKIAEELEKDWSCMFSHSAVFEVLLWGIMHNSGLARISEDADPWKLEVWHPCNLQWDEAKHGYYLQTRETSKLLLIPNLDGTYGDDQGGRWLLYTPYGYGNTRRGLLRSLHRLYLERQWSHRDRARYSEIFGQPIRFGIAPLNSSPDERDEYAERLSPIGAESVIVGHQGEEGNRWDLKLVEASGKSVNLFQEEIEQLDKEIATLVLGQSQSTDGQGGLGTQENAGETVRLDIIRGDRDTLSDALRTQVLVPYCEWAYGAGDMAPWACWDIEPAEDTAAKALEFKNLIDGLVAAQTAAIPVDVRAVLEAFSIPMVTEEEQAAMEAKKQAEDKAKLQAQAQAKTTQNGTNGAAKPTASVTQ
jgi:phage gp29-like protein